MFGSSLDLSVRMWSCCRRVLKSWIPSSGTRSLWSSGVLLMVIVRQLLSGVLKWGLLQDAKSAGKYCVKDVLDMDGTRLASDRYVMMLSRSCWIFFCSASAVVADAV